jgi:inosose dehydratase
MRLAGHTYAFRDRPLDGALDELAGLGLELVEVWLGHATAGPDAAAAALERRGLRAAAVSAGGLRPGEPSKPEQAFGLAEALGAPVVAAVVAPALLPGLAERAPATVTICLENHWNHALARPGDVLAAIGAWPRLAACLDTGHAILAGVRPERFAAALGPCLRHVHLKDAAKPALGLRLLGRRLRKRLQPRPEPVPPGRGALDVARLRRALEHAGFGGAVTVEHEGPDPASALRRLVDSWNAAAAGSDERP